MSEKRYFVDWVSYNAEKKAWNYKQAKMFTNLDDAKKEFHNTLATYIGYGSLTHVAVMLYDECFNIIDRETWDGVLAPTEVTE